MTSSRLERCAGSLRPAWAAFGRLGVAASLIALGATSPAPHAFATTPALNHASMARTGATIAVVNSLASTVTAYGASASGDARPIATLTLGLDIPDCATFDAAGDLWVVNFNGRSVVEYASNAFSGGPQAPERTISSDSSGSLNSPAGCTFDHSGDLWVANDLTNTVVEYAPGTPASGAQVPIATISSDGSDSLSGPVALAFDPSGDLWVANYDNSTVVEYTVSDLASGSQVPAVTISADASGVLNSPLGIAFDRSGDLWVAANLSDKLLEYARSGLATGPRPPPSRSPRTPPAASTARAALRLTLPATCGWPTTGTTLWPSSPRPNWLYRAPWPRAPWPAPVRGYRHRCTWRSTPQQVGPRRLGPRLSWLRGRS